MSAAASPYEQALTNATALNLIAADGRVLPLAIGRYLADADTNDETVLQRCVGPVLDVGCGPGRIVQALSARGIPALGVDIAGGAVALTQDRGGAAVHRSVFDRIPGEGRWPTVLVLDGNVGIGGDVAGLLLRAVRLAAPGGAVIVESSATAVDTDEILSVRFADGQGLTGPAFEWAQVGVAALARHGRAGGLTTADQWSAGGRDFVRFERSSATA